MAMDGQLWMKLSQMCWPMAVPVEKMMESGRHKVGKDLMMIYSPR